jgi:hypothetical protein
MHHRNKYKTDNAPEYQAPDCRRIESLDFFEPAQDLANEHQHRNPLCRV